MEKRVIHLIEYGTPINPYHTEKNFALCNKNLLFNRYNSMDVRLAMDGYEIDTETEEWCTECLTELANNDKY